MADSGNGKMQVSGLGAFAIGLFFGGGLLLIYHALDSRNFEYELERAKRAAEENRQRLMQGKNDRERLRQRMDQLERLQKKMNGERP